MKAIHSISYGLYILTTNHEKFNGCVINTLSQVTSQPNRISITVNKENFDTMQILKSKKFNVSILTTSADFEIIKHFGFQSGRDVDKFADFKDFKLGANGIPYITKATNSYLSAEVIMEQDLGTHMMFIADVVEDVELSSEESLTYKYYQDNIKPKKQANKICYVCTVCGYVYEGDVLPDDYICPLCKHDASYFEKRQA